MSTAEPESKKDYKEHLDRHHDFNARRFDEIEDLKDAHRRLHAADTLHRHTHRNPI